jgi:hypothetical protein
LLKFRKYLIQPEKEFWFGVSMGLDRRGRSLAIFIVLMIFGGLAAGMVAFSVALTLYPGLGVGQLTLNSSQVTGDIMSSTIVVTLNNSGSRVLVIDQVAVLGVNYTLSPEATGVPAISGNWGLVVGGVNSTSLGVGKTGTLYINSSGRITPTQVCPVSVVSLDGTALYFNVTKT